MCSTLNSSRGEVRMRGAALVRAIVKAPIHVYRWTLRPWLGWPCRHLPTCSDYALEAIDRNGAWRGSWLTLSRLMRCQPWGSAGYDPVPDITNLHHPLAPWRYGRWTGRHIETPWFSASQQSNADRDSQASPSAQDPQSEQ